MLKILTAAAVLFACAANAGGVIQCADKASVEAVLLKRGEHLQEARRAPDALWQFFLNADTGTYSLTVTSNGVSCIIAVGDMGDAS